MSDWIEEIIKSYAKVYNNTVTPNVQERHFKDVSQAIRAGIEARLPSKLDLLEEPKLETFLHDSLWNARAGAYNQSCEDHRKALLNKGE